MKTKKMLKYLPKGKAEGQMNNWISVEERLPELWGPWVLVTDGKGVGIGKTIESDCGNIYLSETGSIILETADITHWMPLPDPPKVSPKVGP